MSLRTRLFLAFLAIGSLMLAVGLTSLVQNRHTRAKLSALRSQIALDLSEVDLSQVGIEVEGYWSPEGRFVATDVEVTPGTRRPKLRGAIQSLDPERRTLTLYGIDIRVPDDVELMGPDASPPRFEDLAPGERVEVTCKVDGGEWRADEVRVGGVKASDKVKGTVTRADLDGEPPESLEIEGLRVLLPVDRDVGAESALRRIQVCTKLTMAVHELRALAYEYVGLTRVIGDPALAAELGFEADEGLGVEERIRSARDRFVRYVRELSSGGEDAGAAGPSRTTAKWIRRLRTQEARLEAQLEELLALRDDPARARRLVDETLSPFLDGDLLPLLYAFHSRAEEQLGDQLRAVVASTEQTTDLAMRTSVAAMALALILGFLVWRSIHRPLIQLHDAALRIGQGHFDTRVDLRSKDEIGVLAMAINRMAAELARTTVSMSNLENVFDSMGGAVLLLDAGGTITSANRAAEELLGYTRDELAGRPFEHVCNSWSPPAGPDSNGKGFPQPTELVLRRRDGSSVPVSFTASELRAEEGRLKGYVCMAVDLSERKRMEERLRRSLSEKELLLREIHHRVKNNMQVVSSLLAMQSSQVTEPVALERFEESQNRIRSMALIHEQLYKSDDLSHIAMRSYVELLTEHVLHSARRGQSAQLELRVDDLVLDVDRALACGLIINELVSNAFKHAFPEGDGGSISVSLLAAEGDRCILEVADDGKGLDHPFDPMHADTLGLSLVFTLAKQLGGEVEIDGEDGLRVRVEFPHEQAAATTP